MEQSNQNKTVLFEEYYDTNVEWWNDTAANFTVIPIGVNEDANYNLSFDEEGKKSIPSCHASICGMSGSGKSCLLHTLIVGSCIKYSPDELRLVLVDMKSSEFKQYQEEDMPHAELIASNTTPEEGLHILRNVFKRIIEREDLFRSKEVCNYFEYRKTYPDEVLPRYLIVIDEYGPLLEAHLRREMLFLLQRIMIDGRKLGFNLVLSSQTMDLPSDFFWWDSWGFEPSYRIAMRSNPIVAKSLLGLEDNRVSQLNVGQAIIQAHTTDLVQCYYLPDNPIYRPSNTGKLRSDYLKMIRERWNARTHGQYEHNLMVFDREQPAYLANNKKYKKMTVVSEAVEVLFSPGEKYYVDGDDFMCEFKRAKNENLLSLGGKIDVSIRSIHGCLMSMLPQLDPGQVEIDVVNLFDSLQVDLHKEIEKTADGIVKRFKNATHKTLGEDVNPLLDSIIADIAQRSNSLKSGIYMPPRFLVMFCVENETAFHEVSSNNIQGKGCFEKSETTKKLIRVLETGPEVGVHCMVHFSDADAYFQVLDGDANDKRYFNHRLVLQMQEDDSKYFLDSFTRKDASKLVDEEYLGRFACNIALYYNAYNRNEPVKIKPYEFEINNN